MCVDEATVEREHALSIEFDIFRMYVNDQPETTVRVIYEKAVALTGNPESMCKEPGQVSSNIS